MISLGKTLLTNLVLVSHILVIIWMLVEITGIGRREARSILAKKGLLFGFIIAVVAMLGSLFYSEIAGYVPCKLCWYQRILMYPLTLLFGIALWRKDANMRLYGLVLSGLGGIIALYHFLLQHGITPSIGCNAVGYSVDCSKLFILDYGYLTIPLMALTAFLMIFISLWFSKE